MIELGRQFGLYVIKEKLEETGDYVFCKAEDPFFNREVTLRVYPAASFSGQGNLARVEKLFERLSVLDHPSIAPIYDSGIEGDFYYYTSACYSGGSLASQQKRPLPKEQLPDLLQQLVMALDYAFGRQLENGDLKAENIYFDAEGRAVIADFGVADGLEQILFSGQQTELSGDKTQKTLHSLGLLILELLDAGNNSFAAADVLLDEVEDRQLQQITSRLLSTAERPFGSYAELLAELSCPGQDQSEQVVSKSSPVVESSTDVAEDLVAWQDQSEQAIAEIRQLVAEKNNLQQTLDKAIYARNLAENKFSERVRELTEAQDAVARAQEEANVAWELVAGQKYERWRPAVWTLGGFVIGFLLSGSYGYYYSEQTRGELMAKLQQNEELIKTATLRAGEQSPDGKAAMEEVPVTATSEQPVTPFSMADVKPVKEIARQWWPAGNEFSPNAAIPLEKLKNVLGLQQVVAAEGVSSALREEVLSVVNSWAESWANQDLRSYFSHYSDNYYPELGRSLLEWRDMRRNRLTRPEFIEVNLDDISLRKIDDRRIQVRMKQSYRSNTYQDRIIKSINLIHENGRWRILRERSLGMAGDLVG